MIPENYKIDCGDNSCLFVESEDRKGMRTNGGCRCMRNNPKGVERYARLWRQEAKALEKNNTALKDALREVLTLIKFKPDERVVIIDGCLAKAFIKKAEELLK